MYSRAPVPSTSLKTKRKGPVNRRVANPVEFADLLARDKDLQKEMDTQFLEGVLPQRFRKLKVRQWLADKKSSFAITDEIEEIFTVTNIESKIEAAGGVIKMRETQTQTAAQVSTEPAIPPKYEIIYIIRPQNYAPYKAMS